MKRSEYKVTIREHRLGQWTIAEWTGCSYGSNAEEAILRAVTMRHIEVGVVPFRSLKARSMEHASAELVPDVKRR